MKPAVLFEFPPKTDFSSKFGAGLLVDAIHAYWVKKGYAITAERFLVPGSDSWGVRSNLVAGLPARWRGR